MIYVTQGHEKSIGLEIFLKSCLYLSQSQLDKITLVCHKDSLIAHLKICQFDWQINNSFLHLYDLKVNLLFIHGENRSQSQLALELAIERCHEKDILLTLPTSKDQLYHQGTLCAGHTEFFRNFFQHDNLCMVFKDDTAFHLLLTDHIPLRQVESHCSSDLITKKISLTLAELQKYFQKPSHIYAAGINPHAGEEGILGNDTQVFQRAFVDISKSHPDVQLNGPFSGDTLHNISHSQRNSLFVYTAHDQALAPFKLKNRFWGSNMTLGLPFLRLSVDHGTAFDLYGKNKANALGCLDNLLSALSIHG